MSKALQSSTKQKYQEILSAAQRELGAQVGKDSLIAWASSKIDEETPVGTVLPLRASVKRYLVRELNYDSLEVDGLLPPAAGVEPSPTQPLSASQLALYHTLIEQIALEPVRTVLFLLPSTGMRVGELCSLNVSALRVLGSTEIEVRLSDRTLLLSQAASRRLAAYLDEYKPEAWVFAGPSGGPIGSHAIRKHTRKLAKTYSELAGLCPRVLRLTFAVMQAQRGASVQAVKGLMGHKSAQTTYRMLAQEV